MEFHHRRKQERLTMGGRGEGRIAVAVRRSKIWFLGRGGGVYFLYAVITSPSFNIEFSLYAPPHPLLR